MPDPAPFAHRSAARSRTVAQVIARFVRRTHCVPTRTYGHVYADKLTELSGDSVVLDATEEALVVLKRHKIISGPRMVTLLGRHQREIRG